MFHCRRQGCKSLTRWPAYMKLYLHAKCCHCRRQGCEDSHVGQPICNRIFMPNVATVGGKAAKIHTLASRYVIVSSCQMLALSAARLRRFIPWPAYMELYLHAKCCDCRRQGCRDSHVGRPICNCIFMPNVATVGGKVAKIHTLAGLYEIA